MGNMKFSPYDQVMRRIKAAEGNKELWNPIIRECYTFSIPERNTIDKWSPGAQKNHAFDATAIDSLSDYANRMESQLVPPGLQWMRLEAGSDFDSNNPKEEAELKTQQQEVDKYLDSTTNVLFNHINSSNFSSQIHEAFLDLGISTGAIIVEPGDGIQSNLNFRSVSLSEIIIERTQKGIVDTVWRSITLQAGDIKKTWPNAKLSPKLKKLIKDKPAEDISFYEGVMLNENAGFSNNRYESIVMYPDEKKFLVQQYLESSPWIVFRESTIPGESYGRGRVMRCLPDIKTLNKMTEDYLKGLNFQANPIFTATDDGIINPYTFKLKTGTVNPVGSNDNQNPSLRQMPVTGNIQLLEFAMRGLQDNIRRTLLSKPFGSIEETPVRTATEMSIRNADQQQVISGATGRIQVELLERVVKRSVYILKQAGKIADFKIDGKEVKIKYTSPAARGQDEQELAVIGRFMEFMGMFPPEIVNEKIKVEEMPAAIADVMGLPKSLQRSDFEIQTMKQEQQAQQQAMMQAQQAQIQSEVDNKDSQTQKNVAETQQIKA